ncbi:MAG: hypothetical protein ACRDHW_21825 [Ktedonobacteraceae bacterium]
MYGRTKVHTGKYGGGGAAPQASRGTYAGCFNGCLDELFLALPTRTYGVPTLRLL